VFVAKTENGQLLSLADSWDKRRLIRLKQQERFFCPACKARVHMKIGEKKTWHFAHVAEADCIVAVEAESTYHLKGKKLLYNWLKMQQVSVFLEPYLTTLKQRPDILLHTASRYTAIEFQCSTIHSDLFTKRTKTFEKARISPIWILGGNRMKRIGAANFQFSDMDWLAARDDPNDPVSIRLTYFCPDVRQFAVISKLMPYSSLKACAKVSFYPPESFVHDLLITPYETNSMPYSDWLKIKKRWRLHAFRYRTQPYQYITRLLQTNNVALSQFPPEAGLPVDYTFWIATPCYLWQTWVLYEFIFNRPNGVNISFHDVYDAFNNLVHQHIFQIRNLPLVKNSHYSFALMAYLQSLIQLGILKKTGKKTFVKVCTPPVPVNPEELFHKDKKIFIKLQQDKICYTSTK
jgi:competence protein CoiA